MASMNSRLFIGIDISTQQCKAVVVNDKLVTVLEQSVSFDRDLPEFRTKGGVHVADDNKTITAPPQMWIKAIDEVLGKLKDDGLKFADIAAVSGTGQQHGSVYWKTGARSKLKNMDPGETLHEQLQDCFSVDNSPVWMDSSTTVQCRNLESKVGGPLELCHLTGSRAYERFTGNQIAKIFESNKDAYNQTERISLVSSFGASLFLGDYAAIDESDGSGMNLLNIRTRKWVPQCLEACGDNLEDKLGESVVPSCTILGSVSSYFTDRYGFSPDCKLVAWTGDNPASLAGIRIEEGDMILSLGTSDTVLLWLNEPKPNLDSHVLVNPIDSNDFMALLCFKNGSLTREKVRDECAEGSWQQFGKMLHNTPSGNNGNIGIYFDVEEIVPFAHGRYRFSAAHEKVSSFPPDVEVRAVIEGQLLARRAHAEDLGYTIERGKRILATGGASQNKAILQIVSNVFKTPVYIQKEANSAALGCAYRAKHGLIGGSFNEIMKDAPESVLWVTPDNMTAKVYDDMVEQYKKLEKFVCS